MSLYSWFLNVVKKRVKLTPVVKKPTFVEAFANLSNWQVSTWTAPASSQSNKGTFAADHASVANGVLCLKLTQTKNPDGTFSSVGGELATLQSFGYGTYEMEVRASSTAADPTAAGQPTSGSVTGCFTYGTDSISEIDVEVEGNERNAIVQFTSWHTLSIPNEHTDTTPAIAPHAGFHKYKYIWTPADITFFVDDKQVSMHTKVIPTQPSPFLFNHYGTNDLNWGGDATPDVERYMFVKSFTFTPA